ncbi:hypothetical protein [Sphingobacterium athyrii]|uniref:Uncharacterized protein n=1 Tax=Sphingobacterium athyrii TaxID=2152717 RepID=A0A363NPW6_9SPHI|nr:hypothetical protein [Sphingobacterium athyrii]PUV22760.1 hypothetical protein DCO56_21445 [Sphingobacterium athyrii]
MNIPLIFLKNVEIAREHLGLSANDIDNLLNQYHIKYSSLKKKVSIEAAYYISKIFNRIIEDFINDNFHPFELNTVNIETQQYIQHKTTNEKTKVISGFINAYVIIIIKNFPKGSQFINSDIISKLPPILNLETSIDWTSGLLKGLVKNTNTFRKSENDKEPRNRGEAIYELKMEVPEHTIMKAIKKVDAQWLKEFEEKISDGKKRNSI